MGSVAEGTLCEDGQIGWDPAYPGAPSGTDGCDGGTMCVFDCEPTKTCRMIKTLWFPANAATTDIPGRCAPTVNGKIWDQWRKALCVKMARLDGTLLTQGLLHMTPKG